MTTGRKWAAAGVAASVVAAAVVFAALPGPIRVFRTVVSMLTVQQGTDPLQFTYNLRDGEDIVSLALGATPTSNQVFAMLIPCNSAAADLVMYDKSDSNIMLIATSTSFTTVKQQAFNKRRATAGATNEERFVAQFNVVATNNLAPGGFLTVAGRLHLDTNGCPVAVLIKLNKDAKDAGYADADVTDMEQDAAIKDEYRAGEAHFIGMLNVISGDETNAWLVPLGHMSFRRQLDQLNPPS
ncbi:MAG TPA: hypothetical protein VMV72_07040 [Verrucomicrobiae bacterium]|nr:hypothetical protein [Verrucomicrobiae bacterium]